MSPFWDMLPRAGDETRTRDLIFTRDALYQLSYTGIAYK